MSKTNQTHLIFTHQSPQEICSIQIHRPPFRKFLLLLIHLSPRMKKQFEIRAVVGTKMLFFFQSDVENIMLKSLAYVRNYKVTLICQLVSACRFIINVKICFFDVRESCGILTYRSRERKELEGKYTRRPSSE